VAPSGVTEPSRRAKRRDCSGPSRGDPAVGVQQAVAAETTDSNYVSNEKLA
jgi:hypothetical protein